MRVALVFLLMTLPVEAASPQWRVDLHEPTERGFRAGTLTFERGKAVTLWDLVCIEAVDGHETRTHRRGTAPARRDWVVAEDGAVPPSRLFSLAMERSAALWLGALEGCPSAAEPIIRRIPRAAERP